MQRVEPQGRYNARQPRDSGAVRSLGTLLNDLAVQLIGGPRSQVARHSRQTHPPIPENQMTWLAFWAAALGAALICAVVMSGRKLKNQELRRLRLASQRARFRIPQASVEAIERRERRNSRIMFGRR